MNAIISCREHDHSKRDIYDICETNEGGEVRFYSCVCTQISNFITDSPSSVLSGVQTGASWTGTWSPSQSSPAGSDSERSC